MNTLKHQALCCLYQKSRHNKNAANFVKGQDEAMKLFSIGNGEINFHKSCIFGVFSRIFANPIAKRL